MSHDKGVVAPFVWVLSDSLPNPEDFVLARSRTTLADIYRAGEWEGVQPALPAPMTRDGGPVLPLSVLQAAGVNRNVPMVMATGAASSGLSPERKMNRQQRKAEDARPWHKAASLSRHLH